MPRQSPDEGDALSASPDLSQVSTASPKSTDDRDLGLSEEQRLEANDSKSSLEDAAGETSNEDHALPVELETQSVELQSSEPPHESSQAGTSGTLPPGRRTSFQMVIHLPNDKARQE